MSKATVGIKQVLTLLEKSGVVVELSGTKDNRELKFTTNETTQATLILNRFEVHTLMYGEGNAFKPTDKTIKVLKVDAPELHGKMCLIAKAPK